MAYAAVPSISMAQECLKMPHMLGSPDLDTSQMAAMRELAMLGGRRPMYGVDPDHPYHDRDIGVILHRRGDGQAAWWLKRYLRANLIRTTLSRLRIRLHQWSGASSCRP